MSPLAKYMLTIVALMLFAATSLAEAAPLQPALDTHAAAKQEAITPSGEPSRELGLGLSAEPTPITRLYFGLSDGGLFRKGGRTWFRAGLAPMTGLETYQAEVERWEGGVHTGPHRVDVTLGARLNQARDFTATSTGVVGMIGMRYGLTWGRSTLGTQLTYLPGLFTHLVFSDAYRDTFRERYPENRATVGERDAALFGASHRVQGLLTYHLHSQHWALWSAAGLQLSPGAGSAWASLELGQVPLLLSIYGGYRF